MDTEFELAVSENRCSTVSAIMELRFSDFSIDEFLLVRSQLIGFQANRSQIRTHRPRKPTMTCPLRDHGVLFSGIPLPKNTAVLLVSFTDCLQHL